MPDLSILIPARNEMFLGKTIENILENAEADTEIIAILIIKGIKENWVALCEHHIFLMKRLFLLCML